MPNIKILIVDDSHEMGRMLQATLLTHNPSYAVTVVPSGEEALLESARHKLDLLVTDIRLPGMTGLDLLRRVRKARPDVKAIIITGLSDERLEQQSMDAGADFFLRKPLQISAFLDLVEKCLAASAAAQPSKDAAGVEVPLTSTPSVPLPSALSASSAPAPAVGPAPSHPTAPDPLEAPRLPELLAGLRQDVGAQAVLVLDEHARVVIQAGDLPNKELLAEWALAAINAAFASQKVSRLHSLNGTASVVGIHGHEWDVALAPLGERVLIAILKPGRSASRLALVLNEMLLSYPDFSTVLGSVVAEPILQPPVDIAPSEMEKELVPPAGDTDFETLFDHPPKAKAKIKDADAFWEAASASTASDFDNPDMLNYDQARQLGLAPDEPDIK